jgi:hypothetical protein
MICLESYYDDGQMRPMALRTCVHIFHSYCLEGYLKSKIKSNDLPIECPMGLSICPNNIDYEDVRETCSNE